MNGDPLSSYQFLTTCPKGLASLLAPEITHLGGTDVRETVAGVQFTGTLATAYRVCLHSRLANRLLLELKTFAANDGDDLYQGLVSMPWHEHIGLHTTIAVDFSGRSQAIRNTQFGAQRCKDGIVDEIRRQRGERPSVDSKHPDIRINVRLHRGKVVVALDFAGLSLHRRGYRTSPGKAPLKENIAAALLQRAGWPKAIEQGWPLVDPMCGSGTLLIEAAMMAMRYPPGLGRDWHGFERWLGHDEAQWQTLVAEAKSAICTPPEGLEIRGYDGDITAIRRAEASVAELGLSKLISVRPRSLNTLTRPSHRSMPHGLVICNPPWGERLGDESSLTYLYRQLGEVLHREFQGWQVAIVTSNPALGRSVGLRSHKQYGLSNGALDIHLLLFTLDERNRLSDRPQVVQHKDEDAPRAIVDNPWNNVQPPAESLSSGAQMFANRLRKNSRSLSPWLKRTGVTCYRLYDADMPEYAVAVDIYDGHPHVAEYAPPKAVDEASANKRFDEVLLGVRHVLGLARGQGIATKRRQRQRGKDQYTKFAQRGERIEVKEGHATLLVNLHDYLDTGLFLDHRPLRRRLAEEAQGKHFLNLFCYTGSASVHAALGGARTSTSIDSSNTYLNWYRDNLALNGLSDRQHRAIRADGLTWLKQCDQVFDIILLDPPSFSNSRSTQVSLDIVRDQVALIDAAMAVLAPTGVLYFSNNKRGFVLAERIVERYAVEDISAQTIPEDFKRRSTIHQCWMLRHR